MAEPSHTTFKVCSKCGVEKPASEEHFRPYLNKGKHWIFRTQCRACERETNREINRRRDPAKVAEYLRQSRAKNPDRHREYDRRNSEKNKAPGGDYQKRKYAKRDKEVARERLKLWKAENPDKVRAMWQRTYAKNKDKIYARQLIWMANNPIKLAAKRDRRRAAESGAEGSYTEYDVRELLRKHGRECFYCQTFLIKFHVDHFIPLARGGSNLPDNLRLSCPTCNYSKGGKMPWEWMPDKFSALAVS